MKWDGHTHTKFCRHGSDSQQERYMEQAIGMGFERYSITEHPPLPKDWVDNPGLMRELAMEWEELPHYLQYADGIKQKYAGQIEVRTGLEMDYLFGNEAFSEAVLERSGDRLDEVIVSVHYLPGNGGMRCIDFTADDFREGVVSYYGSMDKAVQVYFDHVELAIAWAGKLPMNKRLGHVNLIRKFQTVLPPIDQPAVEKRLEALLPLLKHAGMGIDVNTAGLRVPTCGEAYVPAWLIEACRRQGIACVYGSDAHRPEHVGAGWDWYERLACD